MASSARSGFPGRTNSRLDAFLRRHLAPEVYDAVRAYEPCIVVSDAEKHTFKYVVLSDQLIYLTENPPKSIRRVVALRDVVAIDLVRSARAGRLPAKLWLLPQRKRDTFPIPHATTPPLIVSGSSCAGKLGMAVKFQVTKFENFPRSLILPTPGTPHWASGLTTRPSVETRLQASLTVVH